MRESHASRLREAAQKRVRLTALMAAKKLDAVLITKRHNFAWASAGGDNHVRHASDLGVASLVFFRKGQRLALTNNIEAPRVIREELAGLGFTLREFRWYTPSEKGAAIREIMGKKRFAADDGTPGAQELEPLMPPLRMALTSQEQDKYRWLGRTTGRKIGEVCRGIRKGMTEEEVAGRLFAALQAESVKPTVMLVAADDRIAQFRHPIPTPAPIRKAVMVVTGARRWGLICSVTRLVRFGSLPPEIMRKHEAVTRVDAEMIAASTPGTPYADVFNVARATYAAQGFPEEWAYHHQGGPTGYIEREYTVNLETARGNLIRAGHAIAWNPSISGTKSEDTILVTRKGPEILSASPGWPCVTVSVRGHSVRRSAWLLKR